LTEQELIIGLRAGQEDSFRWLSDNYQVSVYNTILGIVQSPADAEDLAQEVFIQIFRSIDQFKGDSKLSTWIYRIATTKSLDFLRSRKSKKRFAFLQQLGLPGDPQGMEIPDFHHPGVVIEQKERAAKLFQAIAQLPVNQKTAFVLTRLEQLSHAEVGQIMQVSIPAVESLLHRARVNLKNYLINEL
jgi:RNA polymerase sigma-70 factor (ECF subfamily)